MPFPGFSLFLPQERTLVAAGHVTPCDNEILISLRLSLLCLNKFVHPANELKLEAIICDLKR